MDIRCPSASPDLIPARMLNEFVYCPRLFYLEWVQQEFQDSVDTVAGRHDHRRVEKEAGELPPPEELGEEFAQARSILLSAPDEGLIARIDLLESKDGQVRPVDYKHGRPPWDEGKVWDPDRVQLGAQCLILRANGYACDDGLVYYAAAKQRVPVPLDDELVALVRRAVGEARAAVAAGTIPPPLADSPKCPRCSLVGICLPDEVNNLAGRACTEPEDVRRLYAARDEALPVYVQAQGAKVGKDGDALEIWEPEKGSRKVRLLDVSELCVMGNVQVTAQALNELLSRGIPVAHFSYAGWFYGISTGLSSRNVELRLRQFEAARDPARCLQLARGFVARKVQNCRTLLRRNHAGDPRRALDELATLQERAQEAQSIESLLGIEGTAARVYFGEFAGMFKPQPGEAAPAFNLEERNRRPPRDPVNALLSLAYSILTKDWTVTLQAVGFDPLLGFYHQPRFGRPALALDLMEEFRPLIADSVTINLINNGEIHPSDFIQRGGACSLTPEGRKKFFSAYERRMAILVTVPAFGYQVSYRRLLEVQARLLSRHLLGEIPEYPGFTTR